MAVAIGGITAALLGLLSITSSDLHFYWTWSHARIVPPIVIYAGASALAAVAIAKLFDAVGCSSVLGSWQYGLLFGIVAHALLRLELSRDPSAQGGASFVVLGQTITWLRGMMDHSVQLRTRNHLYQLDYGALAEYVQLLFGLSMRGDSALPEVTKKLMQTNIRNWVGALLSPTTQIAANEARADLIRFGVEWTVHYKFPSPPPQRLPAAVGNAPKARA